jgi:Protein of unknown function (DUF4238)
VPRDTDFARVPCGATWARDCSGRVRACDILARTVSEPRGQHFVPQVYLRAFAEGDTIRVYRRTEQGQTPKTFDTGIKNVAKRRDVYSVQTDQGRDRYIDNNFERIESLLADVLVPVVQERLLTDAQWESLKYLVAIQEARSPQAIDNFTEATTRLLDQARSLYRQHRPEWTSEQIEQAVQEKFPSERLSGPLAADPRNIALAATNSAVREFAAHMQTFHATIITSGAHDFMTSNRPVVWFDANDYPPHKFFGFNRMSPTIEVSYPLTRRKCLFLHRYPGSIMQYALASEAAVEMVNSRTACGAAEVYAFPTVDPQERQRQLLDLTSEAFEWPLLATLLDPDAATSEAP